MLIVSKPADALRELVEHRTSHSKRFDLGNGSQRIVQTIGRVHYDFGAGLEDIDLSTEVDASGDIVANKLPYKFRVHQQGIGLDYQSREDGGNVTIKLDKIGSRTFNRSQRVTATRNGNRVTFADVEDGIDIAFELTRQGVKTYRILKDANATREFRWEVEHDDAGATKVNPDKITGQDALERKVNLEVRSTKARLSSNGLKSFLSTESWNGQVEHTDKVTRIKSWQDAPEYPIAIDPDITELIAADADDGHEKPFGGGWISGTTRCNIGKYSYYFHPGFRFTDVAVAAGSTITAADLILNARANQSGGGGGTLYGNDVDSSAAFAEPGVKPTVMTKTSASTAVAQSTATGSRTYDVTSIVAEIVARAGWATGNNISIFGIGTSGGYNRTQFEDYSDAGTAEAKLEITLAGGGGNHNRLLLMGVS